MLFMDFKIYSKHKPSGDQPKAIKQLTSGIKSGEKFQTLLGVTGSGKSFTVAKVIEKINRPAIVIAHNKTLAAQLCNEFRSFFPKNTVHYFVSYYDYYQPEAYIPSSDTYIDKEAMINDEIDKLRHAATTSVLTRPDTLIVSSVSCIYGLGTPKVYQSHIVKIKKGESLTREELTKKLVRIQYKRTNIDLTRGTFRIRGLDWEIMPPGEEIIYQFSLRGGKVSDIYAVDPVKGFRPEETPKMEKVYISPARHFVVKASQKQEALKGIKKELKERLKFFEKNNKFLEAERLERRVREDIAMIREVGYCNGIENYSRHLSGRTPGKPPSTLLDYFSKGFLTIIDESHVTIPQINGMYEGDRSRKETLVEHGFRLPSALDNRPLKFEEFEGKIGQTMFTSATPGNYEERKSSRVVEQIIRPTGLVDPKLKVSSAKTQVADLEQRIKERVDKKERVLITTLTKKMAEDLSDYLKEKKFKVKYLHSDIKTLERIQILTDLRKGKIDAIVGVNLLREGLDLPEVSLVAILDADKEGFLRSETALIQTIGRTARNVSGEVVLYADNITGSLKKAMEETERRRKKQIAYNKKHNITPKTIKKDITDILPVIPKKTLSLEMSAVPKQKQEKIIKEKEKEMKEAAKNLDFELAAALRDEIKVLKKQNTKDKKQKITK